MVSRCRIKTRTHKRVILAGNHDFPAEGGCTCKTVRYRMESEPLFVHCCHCRWCQRETGSAFVLNAMIEADRVSLLQGRVETVMTPTDSVLRAGS